MNDLSKFVSGQAKEPGVILGKFIDSTGGIWDVASFFSEPSVKLREQNTGEEITVGVSSGIANNMKAFSIVESRNE